ncbi:MAG: hypothetical protein JNJ83_22740 [Verrucomicrobiaceae bacterium]|nr:hypothetical protein [Verrucomicrobiaceae bacterium]
MEQAKQPNPFVDLALTVLLPSFALESLSTKAWLGPNAPIWALAIASALPLGYGVWCWLNKTGLNFFSVFGLIAVILTGGLGLMKLETHWFAFKEASVPVILGLCFPLSFLWKRPLVEALLFQPHIMNVTLLRKSVETEPKASQFRQLIWRASLGMGGMMLLSAVINYALAMWLLKGLVPQTPEHNSALSKLNWGGLLVIGVPMMAAMFFILLRLLRGIEEITGLDREDILNSGNTVRRSVGESPEKH